jgi:transcriptional regulator with XRE-family HTH domain
LTIPPSTPGSTSRAALAARLRQLRETAGLSGNALARRMGIVQSRVWKIENARLLPVDKDIWAWAEAAGQGEQTAALLEMLAEARTEQQFSTAFQRKGGAAALEERIRATEDQATRIGEFQAAVIPGIVQTADYARELMSVASGPRAWGSDDADVEDKISSRLRRQEILYGSSKRVQVVVHEAALRVLIASPGAMAGQLDKLLAVSRLPAVELGVIPFGQRMPAYPLGFRIYDDDTVVTESTSQEAEITDPAEVAVYAGAFEALRHAAVTGDEARQLIAAAAESLR